MRLDPEETWSSMEAPCAHGVWHRLRVRQSDRGDWLGGIVGMRDEEGSDEVVMVGQVVAYAAASKDDAIAEGLRRLNSGGCTCPEG